MVPRARGSLHGLLVSLCVVAALNGCKRTSGPLDPVPSSSALPSAPVVAPPTPLPLAPPAPALPQFRTPLPVRTRDEPAPAKRYAGLSPSACSAELTARALPARASRRKVAGLEAPLELTGMLRGVRFELPRSLHGLMDCRMVLLLDDLAQELARLGVVAVIVNNSYRPGAVLPTKTPAPKSARSVKKPRARRPAPREAQLSQHARGLALDITEFLLADGRTLNVERDWHGALGSPPCGPESRVEPEVPESVALRDLACAIARGAYCNHWITPNRDAAHFNHLHCDIEAGAAEIRTY